MTRAEVAQRERMDTGRGMLRLIIRAWREVTDGIRAGAAKWDQRWTATEIGSPLARRLAFQRHTMEDGTDVGWRMQAILTWMRLIRADKVKQIRCRSDTWRANEQRRLHQSYANNQAAPLTAHMHQPYTWQEQTQISTDTGASSGAAAVILKRRRAHDGTHGSTQGRASGKKPKATEDEDIERYTRERRVDSQLVYTTNAHELYVDRITFWRWRPRTGDG